MRELIIFAGGVIVGVTLMQMCQEQPHIGIETLDNLFEDQDDNNCEFDFEPSGPTELDRLLGE